MTDNAKIDEGYFAIVDSVTNSTLSAAEKMIACYVLSFQRQNKPCYASNERLAHIITLKKDSAKKCIKELVKKGVLFSECIPHKVRGTERLLTFLSVPIELVCFYGEDKEQAQVETKTPAEKLVIKKVAIVKAMVNDGTAVDNEQAEDALNKYDAAYELLKDCENMKIGEAPNDTIITKMLLTDWVVDIDLDGFIETIVNRYDARKLNCKPDQHFNLSWVIMAEMDDLERDGILATES